MTGQTVQRGNSVPYHQEVALLPEDSRKQEPIVYWLTRLFDPSQQVPGKGMTVIHTQDQTSFAVESCPADRRNFTNRVVIVGGALATSQAAPPEPGIFDFAMHFDTSPDPADGRSCAEGGCRSYQIDVDNAQMTEQDVNWAPRTLPLDPSAPEGRVVRGFVASAIRSIATGESRHDPVLGGVDSTSLRLFLHFAESHNFGPDVVSRVASANLARSIGGSVVLPS